MTDKIQSIKKILSLINRYKELSLEEVTKEIVDTMTIALNSIGGAILLYEEETSSLRAYVHSNVAPFIQDIMPHINKPFNEYRFNLNDNENLIVKTFLEEKLQISKYFSDYAYPAISKFKARILQSVIKMNTIISLPIKVHKQTLGVLMIGFHEKELSKDRIDLLEIFADQAGIAINNALQYEELRNKHRELKERYELEKTTTTLLSHELKTPISISYNNVQLLKLFLEKNKDTVGAHNYQKLKRLQEDLEQGSQRINAICSSILQFRELENEVPLSFQTLDLKRSLEPIIRNFQNRAEKKGLEFSYSLKIKSSEVRLGAGVQFEQILINLLDNAIKYTKNGEISLKVHLGKTKLTAEVSDTGIGFDPKHQDKLYDRFHRGSNVPSTSEGLGLGLYMSKKLTEQLNGELEAQAKPNKKGSIFRITLPISSC